MGFQASGVTRMQVPANGVNIHGDLSNVGDLTGGNVQPLLSSVADDGTTFHTVLGQAGTSAENKLKALSATSGIRMYSAFNSLAVMLDPLNFHAALGFEDRNQVHTSGTWTQFPVGA